MPSRTQLSPLLLGRMVGHMQLAVPLGIGQSWVMQILSRFVCSKFALKNPIASCAEFLPPAFFAFLLSLAHRFPALFGGAESCSCTSGWLALRCCCCLALNINGLISSRAGCMTASYCALYNLTSWINVQEVLPDAGSSSISYK